jgi:hypothetical protein
MSDPVFYIHDDDDDGDYDDDNDNANANATANDNDSVNSLENAAPNATVRAAAKQQQQHQQQLTRELQRLQTRCAALEAQVAAIRPGETENRLNWLEHMVRALASVSSRTNPVYWNLAKRDALPDDFEHHATNAARPRSQYEHAPRRDHVFNRQPLPPPPPPLAMDAAERDDANDDTVDAPARNRTTPGYDNAALLARVDAFLSASNSLLSRVGARVSERGDDNANEQAAASTTVSAASATASAAAAATGAAANTTAAEVAPAAKATAAARRASAQSRTSIDDASQMTMELSKLLSKKRRK